MNTPEWIKYDGSDEQNRDILGSKTDVLFRYSNVIHRLRSSMFTGDWRHKNLTHYLICQPHPYADLIDIWRLSGCPVYIKTKKIIPANQVNVGATLTIKQGGIFIYKTNKPDWNIPGAEYSLTPFED